MTITTKAAGRRDRIARLVKTGQIELRKFEDYTKLPGGEWGYATLVENGGSGSYGDFKGDYDLADYDEMGADEDLYVFSRYTGYSDYSGSTVEVANCRELNEQFDGVAISVYGGYDTTDVCFSLRWILTDCDENDDEADSTADLLLDIFEGLEDYPLINDEALSNVEMEKTDEAWDSWASSDFTKGVESALGVELDGYTDSDLRRVFEDCRDRANEYWECENGQPDMYIRVERVVAVVTLADIREWVVPVVLAVRDSHGVTITTVDVKGDDYSGDMLLYADIADYVAERYFEDGEDSLGEFDFDGRTYSVELV